MLIKTLSFPRADLSPSSSCPSHVSGIVNSMIRRRNKGASPCPVGILAEGRRSLRWLRRSCSYSDPSLLLPLYFSLEYSVSSSYYYFSSSSSFSSSSYSSFSSPYSFPLPSPHPRSPPPPSSALLLLYYHYYYTTTTIILLLLLLLLFLVWLITLLLPFAPSLVSVFTSFLPFTPTPFSPPPPSCLANQLS